MEIPPLRSRMKKYMHCCYKYKVSKKLFRSVLVKVVFKKRTRLDVTIARIGEV